MLHRIASFLMVLVLVFSMATIGAADEKQTAGSKRPDKAAKTDAAAKTDGRKSPQRGSSQLKAGDLAPDFELKTLDGRQTVKLSSFRGKKPVALIFGSYT